MDKFKKGYIFLPFSLAYYNPFDLFFNKKNLKKKKLIKSIKICNAFFNFYKLFNKTLMFNSNYLNFFSLEKKKKLLFLKKTNLKFQSKFLKKSRLYFFFKFFFKKKNLLSAFFSNLQFLKTI